MNRVYIGSDHGGVRLKSELKSFLYTNFPDLVVTDLGTDSESNPVDYPDIGHAVGKSVTESGGRGIVICGSGIGISIAANKVPGIRCALVHDHYTARMARQHNDANVIAFGERVIGSEVAKDALRVFLTTDFEGGRHSKRVDKIETV